MCREAKEPLLAACRLEAAEDRQCRSWAVYALGTLASHNDNRESIRSEAEAPLLVASRLDAVEDRQCREYALCSLKNLHSDPTALHSPHTPIADLKRKSFHAPLTSMSTISVSSAVDDSAPNKKRRTEEHSRTRVDAATVRSCNIHFNPW